MTGHMSWVCVKIVVIIVSILALRVSSQVTTVPLVINDSNTISNGITTTEHSSKEEVPKIHLNLCSENDTLSSAYCSCKDEVLSCDFSDYPGPQKNDLLVHGQSVKTSIKRLCLCNTPKNLLLDLQKDLIPPTFNRTIGIHRVDLYNIQGPLHFTDAFKQNFLGDLYLSNISYLNAINSFEFGRGFDIEIEDVEGLECCSKINVSQSHNKPILYTQNTTIGTIHSNAINGEHRWKTLIMERVKTVHLVKPYGIILTSENVNVSFTLCHFNNVSDFGIEIAKFENLVMSKTLFSNSTPLSFKATSNVLNSSLVIVHNEFNNGMVWQLDAHRVVCWDNYFDFWDRDTFVFLNRTSFHDRILSIEYNTVGAYVINETSSIPDFHPEDSVIFNENVLGKCNCSSIHGIVIPDLISVHPSRCDFGKTENMMGHCLIDFKSAMSFCHKDPAIKDLSTMCKNSSIAVQSSTGKLSKSGTIRASGLNISSSFIEEMLKESEALFHIQQSSSGDGDKNAATSTSTAKPDYDNHNSGSGGHHTLYVFLGILGSVIVAVVAAFIVKKRRLTSLRFGQAPSESYEVLTTPT